MNRKVFTAVLALLLLLLSCAAPALAAEDGVDVTPLSVVWYVQDFRVEDAGLTRSALRTTLRLTMEDTRYDLAAVGRIAGGAPEGAVAISSDRVFVIPVTGLTDVPFLLSFRSAADGGWTSLQFRLYDSGDLDIWEDYGAVPTNQRLTVDGIEQTTEIYNIGGYNYFKLRDIAALLSGTAAQFFVDYDEEHATVLIRTGEPYEARPGDLLTGTDRSASALPTMQGITLNGQLVEFENVYNIGGNNFIRLRDMGAALGFGVAYDEATRTMQITTE